MNTTKTNACKDYVSDYGSIDPCPVPTLSITTISRCLGPTLGNLLSVKCLGPVLQGVQLLALGLRWLAVQQVVWSTHCIRDMAGITV